MTTGLPRILVDVTANTETDGYSEVRKVDGRIVAYGCVIRSVSRDSSSNVSREGDPRHRYTSVTGKNYEEGMW